MGKVLSLKIKIVFYMGFLDLFRGNKEKDSEIPTSNVFETNKPSNSMGTENSINEGAGPTSTINGEEGIELKLDIEALFKVLAKGEEGERVDAVKQLGKCGDDAIIDRLLRYAQRERSCRVRYAIYNSIVDLNPAFKPIERNYEFHQQESWLNQKFFIPMFTKPPKPWYDLMLREDTEQSKDVIISRIAPFFDSREIRGKSSFPLPLLGLGGEIKYDIPEEEDKTLLLYVNNHSTLDALVSLGHKSGDRFIIDTRHFYVPKAEERKINSIKPGDYTFFCMLGTDWDPEKKCFMRNHRYLASKESLKFEMITESNIVPVFHHHPPLTFMAQRYYLHQAVFLEKSVRDIIGADFTQYLTKDQFPKHQRSVVNMQE